MSRITALWRSCHALPAALALMPLSSLPRPADEPLRNWFDDPYFQVRSGIRICPVPKGPMSTDAERQHESHSRVERGTSCWLAGKCAKPNAYLYDADVAAAVKARFAASAALADASLWVTVQRRIVWVEGCVAPAYADGTLEQMLRGTEGAELVIVNVTKHPRQKPPYGALQP